MRKLAALRGRYAFVQRLFFRIAVLAVAQPSAHEPLDAPWVTDVNGR